MIGAATVEDAADGRGVVEAVDALAGVVMVVAEGMAVVVTAEGDARALQIRTNINWEAANRIAAFLLCAEHVRQLEGGSPFDNQMEVKS